MTDKDDDGRRDRFVSKTGDFSLVNVKKADTLWLAERLIAAAENGEAEFAQLPTPIARALVELAKRAPEPRQGKPAKPARKRMRDKMLVRRGCAEQKRLLADAKADKRSLTAEAAAEQAAKTVKRNEPGALSEAELAARILRPSRR